MENNATYLGRLAEVVRGLRVAYGLSRRELAARCGVSHTALNDIENGRYDVGVGTLRRLADALGTTAAELLPREREKITES